ncbi:MAG: DUF1501 domain-containing protein [Bryobacteraceae bacterium]|nr:DUF1501 domain-containing protein [Bryobacteraceae bacterium]MDW8379558.1 DUF1501 domain-containing protein [Bryobacterales bacterium]
MTYEDRLLLQTRRQFFRDCGIGLGKIALASLLSEPLLARRHHAAKAEHVIYLCMAGGPSHLELFDYKPELVKYDGKPAPDAILQGKRFAFMDTFAKETPKLLGTRRKFQQHGQSGIWISDLLPHLSKIADDISIVHGVCTENFNHGPAKLFSMTGSVRPGRPSVGAWVTYGIGSESKDLPGFVVLQSGPRGPRGGALLWGSGFLPTAYQGIPFRSVGDPILDLSNPKGITAEDQRQTLDAIRDLNQMRLELTLDAEIATRVAAYEMAYRMQTSGPELIDFSKESPATLKMYGAEPGKSSYANNCLLARRLVERGVRFVQLWHTDWDHHDDITKPLEEICREVDQPTAALILDLKQRGLLDRTLVIWGGEFGRTPMGEVREKGKIGRNHHIDSYSLMVTGGGVKRGITLGASDELGFSPAGEKIEVHDIHATLLHLLGIDHLKLTYRFQGREFRLTDIAGRVLDKLLA